MRTSKNKRYGNNKAKLPMNKIEKNDPKTRFIGAGTRQMSPSGTPVGLDPAFIQSEDLGLGM